MLRMRSDERMGSGYRGTCLVADADRRCLGRAVTRLKGIWYDAAELIKGGEECLGQSN